MSTYTRLPADFAIDLGGVSDAAFRLHVDALLYSNRRGLDCRIAREDLRRISQRPEAWEELVLEGLWVEHEDGFLIVHASEYQPSAADIVARRQEREGTLRRRSAGRDRRG